MGCLLLDAQARILEALRHIQDFILDDIEPTELTGDQEWRRAVLSGFGPKDDIISFGPFTNAALCRAPCFDTVDILKNVQAMSQRTEDHLWSLQCDIPYLRRQLQAMASSAGRSESDQDDGERFTSHIDLLGTRSPSPRSSSQIRQYQQGHHRQRALFCHVIIIWPSERSCNTCTNRLARTRSVWLWECVRHRHFLNGTSFLKART